MMPSFSWLHSIRRFIATHGWTAAFALAEWCAAGFVLYVLATLTVVGITTRAAWLLLILPADAIALVVIFVGSQPRKWLARLVASIAVLYLLTISIQAAAAGNSIWLALLYALLAATILVIAAGLLSLIVPRPRLLVVVGQHMGLGLASLLLIMATLLYSGVANEKRYFVHPVVWSIDTQADPKGHAVAFRYMDCPQYELTVNDKEGGLRKHLEMLGRSEINFVLYRTYMFDKPRGYTVVAIDGLSLWGIGRRYHTSSQTDGRSTHRSREACLFTAKREMSKKDAEALVGVTLR